MLTKRQIQAVKDELMDPGLDLYIDELAKNGRVTVPTLSEAESIQGAYPVPTSIVYDETVTTPGFWWRVEVV